MPDRRRPPDGRQSNLIPEIESLRGLAITLVFLLHVDTAITLGFHRAAATNPLVSPLRAFSMGGHTGVSLFFVISGFLLGRPFLREAAGGRRVSRPAYFMRRALRILPVYFAAVVVASVLCAHRLADILRGVPYLVFLNSVSGLTVALPPYSDVWWSLATEVQFYVLLPLLPCFLRAGRGRAIGVALLVAYIPAYVAFATGHVHPSSADALVRLSHSVLGRAPQFGCGILAAWLCERCGDALRDWVARNRTWLRNGGGDALLIGALLGLGYLLRRVVYVGYWNAEARWHAWHVAEGILWTAVLLALLLLPLRTKPIFCNRIWGTLGLLSYSIYLIHAPLITWSLAHLNRASGGAFRVWSIHTVAGVSATAAACVGLSAMTYWAIERPFLRRKARLGAVAEIRSVSGANPV